MNTINTSTRDQEQERANRIMDFWARHGYEISVEVVPLRTTTGSFHADQLAEDDVEDVDGEGSIQHIRGYTLKSNMRCGWPPVLLAERIRAMHA